MKEVNDLISATIIAGFECAIAIATDAEVQAGAACGQMCLVIEAL
jgi:hypothetical protein